MEGEGQKWLPIYEILDMLLAYANSTSTRPTVTQNIHIPFLDLEGVGPKTLL